MLLTILSIAVPLASGLDHSSWDALLKKYVDREHRVDYRDWKANARPALDAYIQHLSALWPKPITAAEEKAALINAYNAITIQWVLGHYPIKSIWKTKKPFAAARHTVNGEEISLDGIETKLRNMGDPRIHAALVCAARSCPPLRREAYLAGRVDQQLDENIREWLSNPQLNRFDAGSHKASVSPIFNWYRNDFEKNGATLARFLSQFAPAQAAQFLERPDIRIEFQDYRWGLNDQTDLGAGYGGIEFYWDAARNR